MEVGRNAGEKVAKWKDRRTEGGTEGKKDRQKKAREKWKVERDEGKKNKWKERRNLPDLRWI